METNALKSDHSQVFRKTLKRIQPNNRVRQQQEKSMFSLVLCLMARKQNPASKISPKYPAISQYRFSKAVNMKRNNIGHYLLFI